MPTTSLVSINRLADESLAHIFSFLPPDERVRVARVCRKWRQVSKTLAWTEFRTLTLDWQELRQRGDMVEAKFRALIGRCAPYLREFGTVAPWLSTLDQWARMRNLRHLRFDSSVESAVLRSIADNLKRLQSVYFSDFDWRDNDSIVALRDLLSINNASLQALRLPVHNSRGAMPKGALPALPASLRSLHIVYNLDSSLLGERKDTLLDELLDLAASCCPKLAILMLPESDGINSQTMVKLAQFGGLFYLSLCFHLYNDDILAFGNSLAKIGPQLRALLLESADSRVLELVAMHCPELEHFSFGGVICSDRDGGEEGLLSALQAVFQLPRLRSVSITYNCNSEQMRTQILAALNGLNAKGKLEYLHMFRGWPLSVEFITNFIQLNPNLRKLTCAIKNKWCMPGKLWKLKKLLQNMDGPLELELFGEHYLHKLLKMGRSNRVRIRAERFFERISQPLLRQFWVQAMESKSMDSVPDLGYLDN